MVTVPRRSVTSKRSCRNVRSVTNSLNNLSLADAPVLTTSYSPPPAKAVKHFVKVIKFNNPSLINSHGRLLFAKSFVISISCREDVAPCDPPCDRLLSDLRGGVSSRYEILDREVM